MLLQPEMAPSQGAPANRKALVSGLVVHTALSFPALEDVQADSPGPPGAQGTV